MKKKPRAKNELEPKVISEEAKEEFERSIIEHLDDNNIEDVKTLISTLHIADLAEFIDRMSESQQKKMGGILRDSFDPEILVELEPGIRERIITFIGYDKSIEAIEKLDLDEAAAAIADIDEKQQKRIISKVSKKRQKELHAVLSFPENSAGRIMSKKVVSVPEYWTVGQTIDFMRQNNDLPDDFYVIFVVDPKHKPVGALLLSTVMHNQREVIVTDIMKSGIRVMSTELDQEEVAYQFMQYGLVAAPIVNKAGLLVGTISIDDAAEIMEKEAEEDTLHMGGVQETDFHLDTIDIVKGRFPWLFINLLTAIFAASIITLFEDSIKQIVALAAIMPIVATMGGNAGTQTMTVSVVAIASKELTAINALRVITKQVFACTFSGMILAAIGGAVLMVWHSSLELSAIFALSIIINFALAGFFGSAIPVALNKSGIDPAIASPVFLTSITDVFGFLIFLGLATIFLL
jgi:magnesium transporter